MPRSADHTLALIRVLSIYPGGQVYERRVQCSLESHQPSKKDVMLTSLAKHSFGAILLVVIIEEVGIPLPIPSDFLVIFAGTTADHSLSRLVMFYVALTMASGIGASGLYTIVRRGGRPLVERLGPMYTSGQNNSLAPRRCFRVAVGAASRSGVPPRVCATLR